MDVSKRLGAMILVLILIAALWGAAQTVLSDAEESTGDTSSDQNDRLDCIFGGDKDADECVTESSFQQTEVVQRSV